MSHTVRSGNAEPDAGLNRILRLCFAVGFLCAHDFSAGESAWAFGHMNAPAESETSPRSRRVVRIFVLLFAALLVILVALTGMWWLAKQKAARERAQWKGPTLERLAGLSIANEEIRRELDELKAGPTPNIDLGWADDQVLLMTNGEYIIYAFRHGANNGFVDHLFLGHGSDGRWLYSTYHFCSMMAGVRADDPPGSISEFAERYSAREFDGRSDECLQHTWPPTK